MKTARRGQGFGAALLFLFLTLPAQADFHTHFWEDQATPAKSFRFTPRLYGTTTSSNFNSQGGMFTPTTLSRYVRSQLDLGVAYAFNSWFTVYGRGTMAFTWVQGSGLSAYTIGFADQTLGVAFRAVESRPFTLFGGAGPRGVSLDFQIQAELPAYDNNAAQAAAQPYLGDGTFDFTGGLFVSLPLTQSPARRTYFRAGAGFTYRTSNFSSAIPWSAQFLLEPVHSGFTTTITTDGVASMASDPRALGAALNFSTLGANGSYMTGAVNPTSWNVRASAGYKFSPLAALEAEGGATVFGINTAQLFYGGLLAKFSFGGQGYDVEVVKPQRTTPADYARSNQGFVAYTGAAKVIRVNDKINSVRIDRGAQEGVEVGQLFDIFKPGTEDAPGSAVARTQVIEAGPNESTLQVLEYYQETWIENGMTARRPME